MYGFLVEFALVFLLNIIPFFAPPTWMAMSMIGFRYPGADPFLVAFIAATAATSGRIVLARLSTGIVRNRLLSDSTKANIDVIRKTLEKRKTLTASMILLFALGPLPSNYLFIAYGLTALPLRLIAAPFFVGRFVSYAGMTYLAQEAALYWHSELNNGYLGGYFLITQSLLLLALYAFAKIDWNLLLSRKKLRFIGKDFSDRKGN